MTTITRRYRFSASHRLHTAQLSETATAQLYGRCTHPFGDGHDYIVEVSVTGPVDGVTGLVLPIATLDRFAEQLVVRRFANRNINLDIPEFASLVPTTENIAYYIVGLLQQHWPDEVRDPRVRLSRVHVQETDRNGFSIHIAASATSSRVRSSEKVLVHA